MIGYPMEYAELRDLMTKFLQERISRAAMVEAFDRCDVCDSIPCDSGFGCPEIAAPFPPEEGDI